MILWIDSYSDGCKMLRIYVMVNSRSNKLHANSRHETLSWEGFKLY